MKTLKILIDMDEVLANLLGYWVSELQNLYKTRVSYEQVNQWDMRKVFPELTDEQIYSHLEQEYFWENVQPVKDSVYYTKKLIEDGHDVYVVTSSSRKTIRCKFEKMLSKHFPFIPWSHVIVTYNKQMIKGDILIDDAPHNLIGGEYMKLLMDMPHNKDYDAEGNGMIRVNNWEEIYKIIHKESCDE